MEFLLSQSQASNVEVQVQRLQQSRCPSIREDMYPFCFLPVDPLRTSWRRPPQRSVNTLVIAHFLHFSSWFSLSPHGASESTFSHIRSPVSNRFLFIHFLILIHCLFFPGRARLCVCLAGDGRTGFASTLDYLSFQPQLVTAVGDFRRSGSGNRSEQVTQRAQLHNQNVIKDVMPRIHGQILKCWYIVRHVYQRP